MRRVLPFVLLATASLGCAGVTIQPGERGLLFDPKAGGLKREVLQPGYHALPSCVFRRGDCPRIEVFDVSFTTHKETVTTMSKEGLKMEAQVAVNLRPIIAELYELNSEMGTDYYDEIIGPEFRSTAAGVFPRYSYLDLHKQNEKIEDEIEADLRRRVKGRHVEISSVNIVIVNYSADMVAALEQKLVAEQLALKNKQATEAEALRKKAELEHQAEQAKLQAELTLKKKQDELVIAKQQAEIDKTKAESEAAVRLTEAKSTAMKTTLLAEATEKEEKAKYKHVTPLVVQLHAYDALGSLGGAGTHVYLGDWSKVPNFLFPGSQFMPSPAKPIGGGPPAAAPPPAKK